MEELTMIVEEEFHKHKLSENFSEKVTQEMKVKSVLTEKEEGNGNVAVVAL